MNTFLKLIILFFCFTVIMSCKQKIQKAKEFPVFIEMFSPKSNISLDLKNGNFLLDKNEFSSDQIFETEITNGSYFIEGDKLILKGVNKKIYILEIENDEILKPISFDTLKSDELFLAWTTYHKNGKLKQNGGWTKNNEKSGVWTFYDQNGEISNYKLYDKGKLVNDDFKFDVTK